MTPAMRNPYMPCGPSRVTPLRDAALRMSHCLADGNPPDVLISLPRQESWLLIFQLHDQRGYDMWLEDRFTPVPDLARSTLNILDLSQVPRARLNVPSNCVHFQIPRAALDEISHDAGMPRIGTLRSRYGWETRDPVLQTMHGHFVEALVRPQQSNRLFVDHLTIALYAHVAETYGDVRAPRLRTGGLASWQERRAKELMADNLDKDLTLLQIAQACELSLAHFSRAFKASTGTSPHGWRQNHRIARARELLRDDRLSLAEIAAACGFADQSHFTRMFARRVGTGPGAWRKFERRN
jgi:AraC-like DNA-binding protein